RAEVHRREIVSHVAGLTAAVEAVTQSELSLLIQAPALQGGIIEQRTGVAQAQRDGSGGASRAEIDGGQVRSHVAGRAADRRSRGSHSKLTEAVVAPAFYGAIVDQSTGEIESQLHGQHVAAAEP